MIHKRGQDKLLMPKGWREKINKAICPICRKKNHRGTDIRHYYCCSKECTKVFWKQACWSSTLRDRCLDRDNHTCKKCGENNKGIEDWNKRFETWLDKFKDIPQDKRPYGYFPDGQRIIPLVAYEKETNDKEPKRIYFEADHIIPIALGGNQYDLKNYQTLCEKCHRKKTAREAKQFAAARQGKQTLTEAIEKGQQKRLNVFKD